MKVDQMYLVAVAKNGERRPVVSVKLADATESVLDAARRANPGCTVMADPRPWVLVAGDDAAADKWMQTNRMSSDRVVRVRGPADVPDRPHEYQIAAIAHWIRRPALRDAMIRLLSMTSYLNARKFGGL